MVKYHKFMKDYVQKVVPCQKGGKDKRIFNNMHNTLMLFATVSW